MFLGVTLRKNWNEYTRAQLLYQIFKRRTVGGKTLDFDFCDTAGEFEGTFNTFTGVGMGGYGPLLCFNAKAGRNIDTASSAYASRYEKQLQYRNPG